MKKIILLFFLSVSPLILAQERYLTREGSVNFEASVPSFEPVAAENNSTTAIFNPTSGKLAALVLVKAFRFENALMEEHFNENYAESNTYPKAIFEGNLEDFNLEALSSTSKTYTLRGSLTFHGVTKDISVIAEVSGSQEKILINTNFELLSEDFSIKIPKVVQSKVAKTVAVSLSFNLIAQE